MDKSELFDQVHFLLRDTKYMAFEKIFLLILLESILPIAEKHISHRGERLSLQAVFLHGTNEPLRT